MERFHGLTEPQHLALWRVAVSGRAYSLSPRTLRWLEEHGYIRPLTDDRLGREWEVVPDISTELWAWHRDQDRKRLNLPAPECVYGFTEPQVREIMGDRLDRFHWWMRGQTISGCQGEKCERAHGGVVYEHDLVRFLDGRPIVD